MVTNELENIHTGPVVRDTSESIQQAGDIVGVAVQEDLSPFVHGAVVTKYGDVGSVRCYREGTEENNYTVDNSVGYKQFYQVRII